MQARWASTRVSSRVNVGKSEKRRLPVKLQIVFALQHVIEHAESAANAGFGVAEDVISEAEARAEIRLIREVRPSRRAGIAGEDQVRSERLEKPVIAGPG